MYKTKLHDATGKSKGSEREMELSIKKFAGAEWKKNYNSIAHKMKLN